VNYKISDFANGGQISRVFGSFQAIRRNPDLSSLLFPLPFNPSLSLLTLPSPIGYIRKAGPFLEIMVWYIRKETFDEAIVFRRIPPLKLFSQDIKFYTNILCETFSHMLLVPMLLRIPALSLHMKQAGHGIDKWKWGGGLQLSAR